MSAPLAAHPHASSRRTTNQQGLGASLGALLGRLVGAFAVLTGLMIGLGLLVTHVLAHVAPLSNEDAINRAFARDRTATGNDLTAAGSQLGNTMTIIGLMLIVAIVFRLVFHRWRESAFVVIAVSGQALVFLLTTLAISRKRPGVAHLDASPPTSSFPSGHTGAATALYISIAVVLLWHTRHSWWGRLLALIVILLPVAVALSRLYRGMHHPSDVAGAYINGGLCILISARAILLAHLPQRLRDLVDSVDSSTEGHVRR